MTSEELKTKRNSSLKVVLTLRIAACPKEFWVLDINYLTNKDHDLGFIGFILKFFICLILTIPFIIGYFVINLIKLIYYQIKISRLTDTQEQQETEKIGVMREICVYESGCGCE